MMLPWIQDFYSPITQEGVFRFEDKRQVTPQLPSQLSLAMLSSPGSEIGNPSHLEKNPYVHMNILFKI